MKMKIIIIINDEERSRDFSIEIECMWNVNTKLIPVKIGATK
jgi:hypothetical protein